MRCMPARIVISLFLIGFSSAHSTIAAEIELPLIGDQERVSQMGEAGLDIDDDATERAHYDAFNPAAAHNPQRDVITMVWHGDNNGHSVIVDDDEEISLVNGEFEIWGRQLDARDAVGNSSTLMGNAFRISAMGDDDETDATERRRYRAFEPDVAFNAEARQFLVVWRADDNTAPLVDDEYEIWGRLYQEPEEGFDQAVPVDVPFRITVIGNDDETDPAVRATHGAYEPRVAWDPTTGNYLLVYRSNDPSFGLAENEYEIVGQRLNGDGETVGTSFRVSHMGPDDDPAHRAEKPEIAWNDVAEQFLVAWQGDDTTDGEFEIYASTVSPGGTVSAQQRVSNMGVDGDASHDAFDPDIAVNTSTGEYMAAWSGDDSVNDEFDIYARALDISGSPAGSTFRVSHMGPDGDVNFAAEDPGIAWHEGEQRYLVTWRGDDDTAPLVEGEHQVFAQSLNQDGTLFEDRFQVSDINPDETDASRRRSRQAKSPDSVYAGGSVYHMWAADGPDLSVDEFEIFTRRTSWLATTVLVDFAWERPETPDPIVVTLDITNQGDGPVLNAYLHYSLSQEFAIEWENCVARTTEDICDIGDIGAGETIRVTASLDTSDRQPGDHLGTSFILRLFADSAMLRAVLDPNETPDDTSDDVITSLDHGDFVTVLLKSKGGAGALLPLIPLLLLLWSMVARRRRD